jgi:PKD repeat protein
VVPARIGFIVSPTSIGVAQWMVNFTVTTIELPCAYSITNWYWDFGDGTVTNFSAATNPSHTYGPGTFTVTLVTSDSGGNSITNIQPDLITVLTPFQSWQNQYFGCTNCAQAQPYANPSGNGQSNTNQFLAGFSPINEAAYLHVISISSAIGPTVSTGAVTYLGANGDSTWSPGIASRTNILEYIAGASNLSYTNGDWLPTGQTNILSGGTGLGEVTNMTWSMPIGSNAYFRVRVLLP